MVLLISSLAIGTELFKNVFPVHSGLIDASFTYVEHARLNYDAHFVSS